MLSYESLGAALRSFGEKTTPPIKRKLGSADYKLTVTGYTYQWHVRIDNIDPTAGPMWLTYIMHDIGRVYLSILRVADPRTGNMYEIRYLYGVPDDISLLRALGSATVDVTDTPRLNLQPVDELPQHVLEYVSKSLPSALGIRFQHAG